MHQLVIRCRYLLRRSPGLQIALMLGIWALGGVIAAVLRVPIPGAVVGFGLLLAALGGGLVKPRSLRGGADWLIADMLLFFVPAVMAIREHGELWGVLGLKLGLIIVIGTLSVMAGTAWCVDAALRWTTRRAQAARRTAEG